MNNDEYLELTPKKEIEEVPQKEELSLFMDLPTFDLTLGFDESNLTNF